MRGLRRLARRGGGAGARARRGFRFARGLRQAAGKTAGDLDDGSGGAGGTAHRRPAAAAGARRHSHRRRQFPLRGRHPQGAGTGGAADRLRRLRNERRRDGSGARLLPDDRRPRSGGAPPRSRVQDTGAGRGRHSAHPRPRKRPAAPRNWAIFIAAPAAPAISSRWCTTASNTDSWRPMPRA